MNHAIGVDIGGTKIAAGVVGDDGRVLATATVPTGDDATKIPERVADVVRSLDGFDPSMPVGIGAAGFVAQDMATVRFAPNIDWRDEPLAERVGELLGASVIIDNDANVAAWGEFRFGAGKDCDDLLAMTVGTGVGGGIVTAGRLLRGAFGSAAEIGHVRVVPQGLECGCGQRGCLEQYASGTALVRNARVAVQAGWPGATALARIADQGPDALTGHAITALAADGDALSLELLADVGRWLGQGAATLAAVLDPAVIVVGGGVASAGDLLLGPMRDGFARHVSAGSGRPVAEIRVARLGNTAGMIGAADMARVHSSDGGVAHG